MRLLIVVALFACGDDDRIKKLEARVSALEARPIAAPLQAAWWCVDQGNCQRTKAECERNGRCHQARIAYCPIGTYTASGALFAFCYSAIEPCQRNVEEHRAQMDMAAHCVGVE